MRPAFPVFLVLLGIPFAAWPALAAPAAPAGLAEAVRKRCESRAGAGWQVGVVVLDEEGRVRAAVEPDRPLSPASNQKVLVVGAALGLLGPEYRYRTQLLAREPPRDGSVGDLVARGSGDPNVSGRFQGGDATALFRSWASQLKRSGVRRIAGDLVVDDSRFDAVRFLPGWKESQSGRWYSAEVGALNLNDNCVDISIRPTSPGQPARVELKPSTSYLKVENRCRTVAPGKQRSRPVVHRPFGTNTIFISGSISPRFSPLVHQVTVQDPGLYFGSVLAEVLRAEGIELSGRVVRASASERAGASPAVLLDHSSTLAEDLPVINKRSQNLHAEVLLKALGAEVEGEGSVDGGRRAVAAFLRREKIPAEGLVVADGSGLGAGNRVSPATLAAVLRWIQAQPFSGKYLESLPVAGKDGTLQRRFRGRITEGAVFAKTGYISGVSALSGYVRRGGRHWVFSVIVNGFRAGEQRRAQELQEEIADLVHGAMVD